MPADDQQRTHDDTPSPEQELPEAFTANVAKPEPELKQVYDRSGDAERTKTSTGIDIADEGSAESFPASDPPSPMASTSPVDSPPDNAG